MNGVHKLRSLGIALILVLAVGILPLAAQDTGAGQGTGRVNCDSTLILLAGLAQRYFGFTSLSGMDMAGFEYGQYGSLWDMSMTDTPQGTIGGAGTGNTAGDAAGSTGTGDTSNITGGIAGEAQATTDPASGSSDDQMQPEATADMGMGTTPSIYLNPPALMDEDPLCMQLRAELEGFFATQLASPNWDSNFRGLAGGVGMSTAEPDSSTGSGG